MITPERIEAPFSCSPMEIDGKEIWVPYLQIAAGGLDLVAHHFNSLVRQFADPWADHVEVKVDGQLKGIRIDHDIIDKFVEYEYSRRWDPRIDEQTMDWLTEVEGKRLAQELGDSE